jgi:hypothetical protein
VQDSEKIGRIIIGSEVEYISPLAFVGCLNLSEIFLEDNNSEIFSKTEIKENNIPKAHLLYNKITGDLVMLTGNTLSLTSVNKILSGEYYQEGVPYPKTIP